MVRTCFLTRYISTATSPVMATNSDLPVVVQNIDIDLPIEAQNNIDLPIVVEPIEAQNNIELPIECLHVTS